MPYMFYMLVYTKYANPKFAFICKYPYAYIRKKYVEICKTEYAQIFISKIRIIC